MKIAYVHPDPLPEQRTVPLQVLQNVHALGQKGAQVLLFTPEGSYTAKSVLGYPLHSNVIHQAIPNLKNKWWYCSGSSRYFSKAAVKWLTKAQPDVIFARNLKLAFRLLHSTPFPVFFEAHESASAFFQENHPLTWRNKQKLHKLKTMEHFVYSRANGLIMLTQTLANDLKRTYQFTTPTLIQPNGYCVTLSGEQPFAKPADKVVVLYLGSLHPWKGLHTLLEAFQEVTPRGELWIAGGDTAQIEELRKYLCILNLEHRVRLLGFVDPKQRFDLIATADICVHPLTDSAMAGRHTSPLKLFEYMAMGKAIVTACVPAIEEILDENTSLLVPPKSPKLLAQALNQVIENEPLRQQLGRAAFQEAQHYTWENRAQKILTFMEATVSHDSK